MSAAWTRQIQLADLTPTLLPVRPVFNTGRRTVITIVFWNLGASSDTMSHLLCLAKTHDVDILLLAEYPPAKIAASVEALTALGVGSYRAEQSAPAKVLALTRLAREDFVHQFTSLGKEMAIWKLRAPKLQSREALLVGVHLPSKAGGNNETD